MNIPLSLSLTGYGQNCIYVDSSKSDFNIKYQNVAFSARSFPLLSREVHFQTKQAKAMFEVRDRVKTKMEPCDQSHPHSPVLIAMTNVLTWFHCTNNNNHNKTISIRGITRNRRTRSCCCLVEILEKEPSISHLLKKDILQKLCSWQQ